MGLSSHQRSTTADTCEWLTPPEILSRLGEFDLDPCAPVLSRRPWSTARHHFTVEDDGLSCLWHGRVWMNPPFGREATRWMRRLVEHGDGIALIPARTETAMFFETVWRAADAVLFIEGRPHFYRVDGTRAPFNSGAPICLVAYGERNAAVLAASGLGHFVRLAGGTLSHPA